VATAALLLWFWPWTPAVEHLLVLGILNSFLADISLTGFRKIPFTCSYLLGKSKVHMVFWFGVIPVVIALDNAVELEQRALASPARYWTMAAILGTAGNSV